MNIKDVINEIPDQNILKDEGGTDGIMYVLTNQEKSQGAAYMFDQETMVQVADKLQGNLVILPSSRHEVLVMKETEDTDMDMLRIMVEAVNGTIVEEEDFLSEEVYRYDAESSTLTMVENLSGQQMGMM